MELSKKIKMMLVSKDIKQIELAEKYGMSKNTFNNFLRRDNFKISEIQKMADILGYDVVITFIDRKTKEEI